MRVPTFSLTAGTLRKSDQIKRAAKKWLHARTEGALRVERNRQECPFNIWGTGSFCAGTIAAMVGVANCACPLWPGLHIPSWPTRLAAGLGLESALICGSHLRTTNLRPVKPALRLHFLVPPLRRLATPH